MYRVLYFTEDRQWAQVWTEVERDDIAFATIDALYLVPNVTGAYIYNTSGGFVVSWRGEVPAYVTEEN